jgi:probable F420-dependent oxidoreductase
MNKIRPFHFGVTLLGASSRQEWVSKVKRAEELGYTSLQMPDHLGKPFLPPLLTLMLAAEVSSTLRLGTKVLDNNFRHLVLQAQEIATLDLFSGGRIDIGLGAGYMEKEYWQAGIPFDPPGIRVGRLEESVRLLKALFGDRPVTSSGRYYNLNNYESFPKPLQRPHPPILLAGGGKRMLSIAAREADIISLNPRVRPDGNSLDMQDASAEATAQKIDWIRQAAGERFDQIALAVEVIEVVRTDGKQQPEPLTVMSPGEFGNQPLQGMYVLVGSVDQICEQVLANRERFGISHVSVMEKNMEDFAPIVARLSGQ